MALFKGISFKTETVEIAGNQIKLAEISALDRANILELATQETDEEFKRQVRASAHLIANCIKTATPEMSETIDNLKAELLNLPESELVKLDKAAQRLCGFASDDDEKKPLPEETSQKS